MIPFLTAPFAGGDVAGLEEEEANPLLAALKKKAATPGVGIGGGATAPAPTPAINPAAGAGANLKDGFRSIAPPTRTDAMRAVTPPVAAPMDMIPGGGMPAGPRIEAPLPDATPALPGQTATSPNDPISKARYDFVMQNAARDGEGNLEPGGGVNRSFKDVLTGALLGATRGAAVDPRNPWGGLIGGGAAGALVNAINPVMGRSWLFEQLQQPGIEADQKRQQAGEDRAIAKSGRALDLERGAVGLEGAREDLAYGKERRGREAALAPIDAEKKRLELADLKAVTAGRVSTAKREDELKASQAKYNEARAIAVATGKPSYQELLGTDGKIHKFQIFGDGSAEDLGVAGKERELGSREKIASQAEGGRNSRAAIAEGGRNTRAEKKGVAGGSGVSLKIKASGPTASLADLEKLLRK